MNIHSVILKPRFPFTPEIIPGKVSQIESYRVRMNRVWETGHPSDIATTDEVWGHSITSVDSSLNDSIWTIQLSDIPLAGQNSVLVQNIHESTIYETDDIIGYLDELGYMHENEFWINGLRFYYGNIVMELTQLYIIDKSTTSQSNEIDLTLKGESNQNTSLDKINQKKLKVFNSKGSYHLKCFINIGSLNDLENVSYAIKQLEILKKELSEIVDLKVPDRTLMDIKILLFSPFL